MDFITRMRNRLFDIRERVPANGDEALEPEEAADEVATLPDEPAANEEPDDFPQEGEMTTDEAAALQAMILDAQRNSTGESEADIAQEAVDATKAVWEADDEAYLASGVTSDGVDSEEERDSLGPNVHIGAVGHTDHSKASLAVIVAQALSEAEGPAVSFRDGENIEPIGFDAPFVAEHATGEMLTDWHIRLVYDHDMPDGDDEPIVELYDGETGEFVSDYWVSTFCDNSDEREGQGLACKGAVKRFRIMYDDLVGMQGLVRPVEAVEEWYVAHEGDMPDHDI